MASKGRPLSKTEIRKIVELLASTDMTIAEIAARMGCARGTVLNVNRKCAVRAYSGNRSRWTNAEEYR